MILCRNDKEEIYSSIKALDQVIEEHYMSHIDFQRNKNFSKRDKYTHHTLHIDTHYYVYNTGITNVSIC